MSWLKKLFKTRCMVCHDELIKESSVGGLSNVGGISLFFGDPLFAMWARTAYRCRKCGAPICMSCAYTSRCLKCGGNTFDRAIE